MRWKIGNLGCCNSGLAFPLPFLPAQTHRAKRINTVSNISRLYKDEWCYVPCALSAGLSKEMTRISGLECIPCESVLDQ